MGVGPAGRLRRRASGRMEAARAERGDVAGGWGGRFALEGGRRSRLARVEMETRRRRTDDRTAKRRTTLPHKRGGTEGRAHQGELRATPDEGLTRACLQAEHSLGSA